MSDITPPLPPLRPLAGFLPTFSWGLRLTCRLTRLLALGIPLVGLCILLAKGNVGANHTDRPRDAWFDLWLLLDEGLLGYVLPLIALLTIASGLRVEIGRQTLVYHLVRPVSRTTLYLARFASGVVPATLLGTLALAVTCFFSGLEIPAAVWWSMPLTAFVTAVTVGSFYYLVTSLFRAGMIIALVYTFVFEPLFANSRGAMQKLSIMFHVRGVHHGLTESAFTERSDNVVRALDPQLDLSQIDWNFAALFEAIQERVAYDPPATALMTCGAVAVVMLAYGIWRIGRRDFPLKD